jgi:ATP-dependent helicase/nuclease subunit A
MSDPQRLAADPTLSAVVRANAGSGKTKTLVDRVARLLLRGARPEAILSVTYTKAAASEMQRRLFAQLGDWAVADDARLVSVLARLEGRPESHYHADMLSRGRRLFAQALETPGGLKIQTIHAFCEKLLRQFPLEAGVTPGFEVLDDVASDEVARRARNRLAELAQDTSSLTGEIYARLAVKLDWSAFERLFSDIASQRLAIKAFVDDSARWGGLIPTVAAMVGLDDMVEPEAVEAAAFQPPVFDADAYFRAAAAFAQGSEKTDQVNGRILQAAAEQARAGAVDPEPLWNLFFIGEGQGTPRASNFPTKKVDPAVADWVRQEQERLEAVREILRASKVASDSFDVMFMGYAYASAYDHAKNELSALDFSDLIHKAGALLRDRPSAAWVLFKLDGGVDHILVDEAQDTAPEQWAIIRALTGEFFAGDDGKERILERTVFIVGDEKQSIFSFQGADPKLLGEQSQYFSEQAAGVGRRFEAIELQVSFRSTPQVLDFVDRVFAEANRAQALAPAGGEGPEPSVVKHVAHRAHDPGVVDIWPPIQEEKTEQRRAWDDPLDEGARAGAWKQLAERIAAECEAIVARGDLVGGREGPRPAGFGDILVLVRKRGALFEETLRALKKRGVPVAGADQLKLSQHPVFEDLLSLARFALFPWDDLTLAELLRSPLCDVSDDDLFVLAHGRRGALFGALLERGRERPSWDRAAKLLSRARDLARGVPPFEFYSRLLCAPDDQGRSLRQRFATRLGPEAAEALDAFLNLALNAEQRGVRDLEQFCAGLEKLDMTIKREMDEPRGEVRVMTAHGSKGLEAPIVFLPDTVFAANPRASLARVEGGGFMWLPNEKSDCTASRAVREARALKEEQELARLLYVGLTRARDRLILTGRLNATTGADKIKGWLPWLQEALGGELTDRLRQVDDPQGFSFQRHGPDPQTGARTEAPTPAPDPVPDWALRRPASEPDASQYASPSTYADARRGATPSPLAAAGGVGRFRRGDLIHKLFQILPDLAVDQRSAAADRLLSKERDLTPEQRREMAQAALNVLHDARFAEVFGEGSRAEAAVAGTAPDLPAGLAISGRVDRMIVRPDRVMVIDFKTNRPAPDRIDNADPAYIVQMSLYAAVLRAIFPGRRVEAALVWTDGPRLMPVPENLIDQTLARLRRAG